MSAAEPRERGLHETYLLEGEEWWACSRPEAKWQKHNTLYDPWCRACWLALGANAMHDNAPLTGGVSDKEQGSMREVYERVRGLHDLPPLPAGVSR